MSVEAKPRHPKADSHLLWMLNKAFGEWILKLNEGEALSFVTDCGCYLAIMNVGKEYIVVSPTETHTFQLIDFITNKENN